MTEVNRRESHRTLGLNDRRWLHAGIVLLQIGQRFSTERPRRARSRVPGLGKAKRPEHDSTRNPRNDGVDLRKGGAEQQCKFATPGILPIPPGNDRATTAAPASIGLHS